MKGLKRLKLGLAGIAAGALLLAGGLLLATQASAISGSLSMGSGTAAPGAQTSVDLKANVGTPGLGAWTVDISYDPSKVSVVSCSASADGVCNAHFPDTPNTVRITGANATGHTGDYTLGSITFACGSSTGTSPLGLSVEVFADSTIGAPRDIDETVTQGSISCATAPTAGPPAATATLLPRIVVTGMGGSDSGGGFNWLIAALAATGVLALAGYGALRLRTRNSLV